MQVSKWGNSLAVRLPASVIGEILARSRKYRGKLPADFKFDRIEAHERK